MALLDGGGYAEQAVAPEGFVMHIPDRLGFEEAAGIPEVGALQPLHWPQLGAAVSSCRPFSQAWLVRW